MSDDRLSIWWGKIEYKAPHGVSDEIGVNEALIHSGFEYVDDPDYVMVKRGELDCCRHYRLPQPNARRFKSSDEALRGAGFERADTE